MAGNQVQPGKQVARTVCRLTARNGLSKKQNQKIFTAEARRLFTAEARRRREKHSIVNSAAGAVNKIKLCASAPLRFKLLKVFKIS